MTNARLLLLAAALAGCKAEPPAGGGLGEGGPDAGAPFADFVIAWGTREGGVTTCSDRVPDCGTPAVCGPGEVLGPPDAASFSLPPDGIIEIALLCSYVLERGLGEGDVALPDLKLWATFDETAFALVELSFDGVEWEPLVSNPTDDPDFEIDQTGLTAARVVRIVNTGQAPIALDAVEALR